MLRLNFTERVLTAALFTLPFISCNRHVATKPNIIWIVCEDMSPDLGCYGNSMVRTSNLDSMAGQGVYYTNVFANGAVCTPSRTSIALGLNQNSVGGGEMRLPDSLQPDLPAGVVPFTRLLEESGYVTANIKDEPGNGKLDWEFRLKEAPFQKHHWDDLTGEEPFFAYINLQRTHRPFRVAPENRVDPAKVNIPPYYPDNIVSRQDFADYYGDIQELDKEIKVILDSIQAKGLGENTIIFFFSDHGRDFLRAKHWLYNAGTHIPLIVSRLDGQPLPGNLKRGTAQDALISGIDITATTLSLAGIKPPSYMQGIPFLGKYKLSERENVYSATNRVGGIAYKSRSVRNKRLLYIKNYNTDITVNDSITSYNKAFLPMYPMINLLKKDKMLDSIQVKLVRPLPKEELYDLEKDTFQIRNLIDNPKFGQELIKMRDLLNSWQKKIRDQGMIPERESTIDYFIKYENQSYNNYKNRINRLRQKVEKELGK